MSAKDRLFRSRLKETFKITDPDGEEFTCRVLNAAEEASLWAQLKAAEQEGEQGMVLTSALWLGYYLVCDDDHTKRALQDGELPGLLENYNAKELSAMAAQIVQKVMPELVPVVDKAKNSETQSAENMNDSNSDSV